MSKHFTLSRSADIPVRLGCRDYAQVNEPAGADRNVRAPGRSLWCVGVLGLLLALAAPARADYSQIYSSGFQNAGVVPDGNLSGWSDMRGVTGAGGTITDLSVTLNLAGGWNGDLYAYLVHNDGFAVLLNRVGRGTGNEPGYGNSGMSVVFDAAGAGGDIHGYGGASAPSGLYIPDGRNIDPQSTAAAFSAATPSALLSSFYGGSGDGSWTLFIADVSGGDQSTVSSWGLDITTASVPEPGSLAMAALVALVAGGFVLRQWRRRGKSVERGA